MIFKNNVTSDFSINGNLKKNKTWILFPTNGQTRRTKVDSDKLKDEKAKLNLSFPQSLREKNKKIDSEK